MQVREIQVDTPDGRSLEVLDTGRVSDPAILVHHGTPGARGLFAGWLADAERQGIRLIGYSRPGYGGSTRDRGRQVVGAATDVAVIADHLQLDRLATWGYSGGGPHALGCAARLPGPVVAAATIASPAPYAAPGLDFLAGMGEDNVEEFGAALAGEAAVRPLVEAVAAELPATVEAAIRGMGSILSDPGRSAMRDRLGGGSWRSWRMRSRAAPRAGSTMTWPSSGLGVRPG